MFLTMFQSTFTTTITLSFLYAFREFADQKIAAYLDLRLHHFAVLAYWKQTDRRTEMEVVTL